MKEKGSKTINIFKKLFLLVLITLSIIFSGCNLIIIDNGANNTLVREDEVFTIYTVNDFHGCIFENGNQAGISKIGKFLHDEKENNPDNVIILSAGDMFQGTLVSSFTRGEAVLKCMNYIGFDAMAIGNHEWDWGIEEILKYQDGDQSNGEADFPFLTSNVKYKPTGQLASWATPYTVIERSGYRFGIIGSIGEDEINDILATYVEDYEFTDEFGAIKKYTKILREKEKCDFVIVVSHNDTTKVNVALASLSDEYKIDAIINGHTHQAYYGLLNYGDRLCGVPYIQSGCYGSYVGKITLELKYGELLLSDAINIKASTNFQERSKEIDNIINNYSYEIALANEELGLCGETMYKNEGGIFAANALLGRDGAVVGVCNSGGIRSNAFPINKGAMITYGDVFEIMPFENTVVVSSILGKDLIRLFGYSGLYFSSNVDTKKLTVDGNKVDEDQYYRVASIDFLFAKNSYPFRNGKDIVLTGILFRDEIKDAIKENAEKNGKFYYYK